MLLRYFYDKTLAQASYLVGCQKYGEAMIIDPARHIQPYLDAAKEEGLKITHVTETHIHADFVSGSRELATATGATLYLSDMGDKDWKYTYKRPHLVLIHEGDQWMVGNVQVRVLATPGHTPEHVIFQITDTASADAPIGLFTGDFVFVGDVGRPDLLDEVAGFKDTKVKGAQQLYHSLQRVSEMPDYLQIWPGHGAGSACGKALGAIPSTTLGYEKRFNPAFRMQSEGAFVEWLLEGQPEAPHYFAQMKKINKAGPALLKTLPEPQPLDPILLEGILNSHNLVLDTRPQAAYASAHVPGTLSIPFGGGFTTYAGWFVDYDKPTYLITPPDQLPDVIRELRAIGVDNIPGYFTPDIVNEFNETITLVTPEQVHAGIKAGKLHLLDVRNRSEYEDYHIPGAQHIPYGYLPQHLDELPRDQTLVTQCLSGVRSHIATSLLKLHGFTNVVNLEGGITAWEEAGLPLDH